MSQMDDIEQALENDPELRKAVEHEGQTLQNAGVTQDAEFNNPPPDNSNDANTNEDSELYRSPESDVGNMDGRQIPSAEGQEATTQMDTIEAAHADIPDSVKQEAMSQMDRLEAAGVEKANDSELSSPNQTPSVEKDEPSLER